jgi:hypothetical protein
MLSLHKAKLHGFKSARELYHVSGCHLFAGLVPTFMGKGVSRGQRKETSWPLIRVKLILSLNKIN